MDAAITGLMQIAATAGVLLLGGIWFIALPRIFWLYSRNLSDRLWCFGFWLFWTALLIHNPVAWLRMILTE